jgi:hypothetical protein
MGATCTHRLGWAGFWWLVTVDTNVLDVAGVRQIRTAVWNRAVGFATVTVDDLTKPQRRQLRDAMTPEPHCRHLFISDDKRAFIDHGRRGENR